MSNALPICWVCVSLPRWPWPWQVDERLCMKPDGSDLLGCHPSYDGELWACYVTWLFGNNSLPSSSITYG